MGDAVPVDGPKQAVVEKATARRPRANAIIRDIRAKALHALKPRLIEIVRKEGKVDPGELLELALRVSVANMADTRGAASNGAIAVMLKLVGDGHRIMKVAGELQDLIRASLQEAEARALEDAQKQTLLEMRVNPDAADPTEPEGDDFLDGIPDFSDERS